MKKLLYLSFTFILVLILGISCVFAQVGINSSNAVPNSSAGLDVDFTNKGLLIPRVTTAQRNAISSPADGLFIFNTDCQTFNYYNGGAWIAIGNISNISAPGSITGNSTPCMNATGVSYSISTVANATSYSWTVPSGASITGGQGTSIITVN